MNIHGIWALKPHYLGPWTLKDKFGEGANLKYIRSTTGGLRIQTFFPRAKEHCPRFCGSACLSESVWKNYQTKIAMPGSRVAKSYCKILVVVCM